MLHVVEKSPRAFVGTRLGFARVRRGEEDQQTCPRSRVERLSGSHASLFEGFLSGLESNGDSRFFHPHGFDRVSALATIQTSETGPDEYWLLLADSVIAYGMLRGWSEGFLVPSLGVAVSPAFRGRGWSLVMMKHLHERARTRGAHEVRLKVYEHNKQAIALYLGLGYVFERYSSSELLGHLRLTK